MHGELYSEIYKRNLLYKNEKEGKRKHLSIMYQMLGDAYDKDRNLDKALTAYKKCLEFTPESQVPYIKIANIFRKKNDLDSAIKILEAAISSKYYHKVEYKTIDGLSYNPPMYNDDFIVAINSYYEKYLEMKKRGYVYRPRKSKR